MGSNHFQRAMRLSNLAPEYRLHTDGPDPFITGITEDSRQVAPGHLFVAIHGTLIDGHRFIHDALRRGAAAVAVQDRHAARMNEAGSVPVPLLVVPSSRTVLGTLAARFYGHPARELDLIGVTGTFGKTTTSEMVRRLVEATGRRPAVLGTLGARYRQFVESCQGLTTPAPVQLHRVLRTLRDQGADTVVIEVTSHALRLGRIDGLELRHGVLNGIVPGEHLDFHRSYEEYVSAKRRFIQYLQSHAVLAYDGENRAARGIARDARVARLAGAFVSSRTQIGRDDVALRDVVLDRYGCAFTLRGERFHLPLLGRGNVRGAALALALMLAMDMNLSLARRTLAQLTPLPRRMERFSVSGRTVLDDSAVHPHSIQSALEVAELLPRNRLLAVCAVRGGRGVDINRRNALMLADLVELHEVAGLILTPAADVVNEPNEVSAAEADAVRAVFEQRALSIIWRDTLGSALETALQRSVPGDLLLLLGAQGMDPGASLLRQLTGEERERATA
jgi:UDP-N-acetylmuramoyl-L-alanyl-D-glutamate--2,6-diaminopimelate ligase